ncbi:MAG TPA: FTR1 family protein [Candidatus Binataceae bacterium]|nr:FTR1 family protein [Candidatus Binataceae bacterium]
MTGSSTVLPYFLYSFGILFREGFEALIVVIALVAGTREAGESGKARGIYAGAAIAIVVSAGLAWSVNHFLADNTSDTLEGIFQIFAAATLFYVSSWLTSKAQAEQWMGFIRSQIRTARESMLPSVALGLTAFLAVMREGAETIVFFQALVAGATATPEKHAVMAGVAAGFVALAIVFLVLTRAAIRIPIGSFFSATTVLLYGLAVVFVGQGVASFQESGWIAATFIAHVPTIQVLGLFPTVQTIVAQAILLSIAAAAFIVPRRRAARAPKLSPATTTTTHAPQARPT